MERNEIVKTMIKQIGTGNFLAISGGRIHLNGTDNGMDLPVSNGYKVRVLLDLAKDTYTVARMYRGRNMGQLDGIYWDQLGDIAYSASCFHNGPFGNVPVSG